MQFHPGAKPEFVQHVASRRAQLQKDLVELLPHRPVTLEIGCGHGHFLVGYAQTHPQEFCLGIDIIQDRLDRADRKRCRAGLENIRFLKAEAAELLECLPAATTLHSVFLLFPDPWPKKRHHKNRLVQPAFMAALARWMQPGGRFHFRTDHGDYFAAGTEVVAAHRDWQIEAEAAWPFEEPTIFQQRAPSFQSLIASRRALP